MKEFEKALYIIDMNNGFVNFDPMANPAYNGLVKEQLRMIEKIRREMGFINFVLKGHIKNLLSVINKMIRTKEEC